MMWLVVLSMEQTDLTHHEIAPFPEHLCDVVGCVKDRADSFNSP